MMKIHISKDQLKSAISELDYEPQLLIFFKDTKLVNSFTYFKYHHNLLEKLKCFEIDGNYYINELVLDGVRRKPYLDLETIYPNKKTFDKKYKLVIGKLQSDLINIFKTEYKEKITIADILLLDSSGEVKNGYKFSFHIIISPKNRTLYYTNSKSTKSSACHLRSLLVAHDATYEPILDANVYSIDQNFRIIESCKNPDDVRFLSPVDGISFDVLSTDAKDKRRYMLTYILDDCTKLKTPIIGQKTRPKTTIKKNDPAQKEILGDLLRIVKKYHPSAKHSGFYKDSYHRFSYTDQSEICPIKKKEHSGTNGFYIFEKPRGYYLKCFSKKCTESKHIGYSDMTDGFIDSAHQINQQYLIMDKNKLIKNGKSEPVKDLIIGWLKDDTHKTLAIKSAMGTGKTATIKKILSDFKSIKKVLWVSYRQTLSKQIYGSFGNDYGFESYMNVKGSLIGYDRVIVQSDSIMRIAETSNGNYQINQYDLVILDEIEGNLNHFNSPYLNKPNSSSRDKFDFLIRCVDDAKKLLVLDADLGMRSKLFIDHFGKSIIINNNYKPDKKIFTVTNSHKMFYKKLYGDVKNKKNVCVISMSANALDSIAVELGEKKIKSETDLPVKYIMHTSKTDDELKDKLEDVNKLWVKYQVVMYSPTIESGVDFNEEHFDKIYCILRNGQMTCSQRGFNQMIGRIRKLVNQKPKSDEIIHDVLCLYDGPTRIDGIVYTYDDMLSYFRYYERCNGKKIIHNSEYTKIIKDGKVIFERIDKDISLFDHISIYNEVEQHNKHSQLFMTVLNKIIQRAGNELVFDIRDNVKKQKNACEKIETILANIDDSEYDIRELIHKQTENKLTSDEKMILKKKFFMKVFGIKNSKNKKEFKSFAKKFIGKEIYLRRYERLFEYGLDYDYEDDNCISLDDGPNC
jgi:hypothetical protein